MTEATAGHIAAFPARTAASWGQELCARGLCGRGPPGRVWTWTDGERAGCVEAEQSPGWSRPRVPWHSCAREARARLPTTWAPGQGSILDTASGRPHGQPETPPGGRRLLAQWFVRNKNRLALLLCNHASIFMRKDSAHDATVAPFPSRGALEMAKNKTWMISRESEETR